jgi:flagellar biosynthesis/type III secretory pathway M-ring protein FliF/YscJ
MEINVKKILKDIHSHLAGLTVSQKMLIATLVVGIAAGLIWLVSWAGAPERVPLLDQPMSSEEISRATATLSAMGVDHKVEGDRILVPPGRRTEALGRLSWEGALPSNIENGFDKLFESEGSMWDTPSDRELKRQIAKQNELANWLRGWPGVRSAKVIIGKDGQPALGRRNGDVTASVQLQFMPGEKLTNRMARKVANLVAGSISDINKERIAVADATNGETFNPLADQDGYSTVLHELREAVERDYQQKLLASLGWIPGVRPVVNVVLKDSTIERVKRDFNKDGSILQPIREEEHRETSTSGRPGGEAGIRPMVGGGVASGSDAGRSESSSTKTENLAAQAMEYIRETSDKGGIKEISASISLPSTYIQKVARAMNPQLDHDPEFRGQAYQDVLKKEIENVRNHVAGALGVEAADAGELIRVSDFLPTGEAGPALAAADGGPMASVGAVVGQFGRPVLLGAVALVSLFLVASMVKRAAPAPLVIRERAPAESAGERDVAAEAEQLEGVLPGIEVDEETLRVNNMVQQVNEMIHDNLDSATGLVRRWIAEDAS